MNNTTQNDTEFERALHEAEFELSELKRALHEAEQFLMNRRADILEGDVSSLDEYTNSVIECECLEREIAAL